jgi:hypothetical protein
LVLGDFERAWRRLEQGFSFLGFEGFDDLGYVLGAVAGADEDGVVGFDQDNVVDA